MTSETGLSMGFPMEMYQAGGGAIWVVSHKPVAVEAGLGHMGIHRNLIYPKFGNFVLLGTVLMSCEATDYDHPIEYNPCLECKLCVAACPVGAIGPECDPYNPLVALYDVGQRYDEGWQVVHKAQKSKTSIAPELLESLKKDSGRSN